MTTTIKCVTKSGSDIGAVGHDFGVPGLAWNMVWGKLYNITHLKSGYAVFYELTATERKRAIELLRSPPFCDFDWDVSASKLRRSRCAKNIVAQINAKIVGKSEATK